MSEPKLSLAALYRYPVKGLSAERLAGVDLVAGGGIPGDRRYAISRGADPADAVDPAPAGWRPKAAFLALHNLPALGALDCRVDPASGRIEIRRQGQLLASGDPRDPAGKDALERFFAAFAGPAARGMPRLYAADGVALTDSRTPLVSLATLASLHDLERSLDESIDVRRFRVNLVIDGGLPWQEFDWVGQEIRCGEVVLAVEERIVRCAAIHANPRTGEADGDLLRPLSRRFGEAVFGVYARVVRGGRLEAGARVSAPAAGRLSDRSSLGLR